ncbi:MAG: GNAT family acetyltransferase [Treponema sp.]
MTFNVVNMIDLLDSVGEEEVRAALSDFKCKKNSEIENFLKNNAIDFARQKISVTHLILDDRGQIAAYFTLTHKPSNISASSLSNSAIKTLSRYAILDNDSNSFNISAFLIAQFGKNSAYNGFRNISGNKLMDYCFEILESVQKQVGGGIAFLECEDKKKLLDFYQNENNRFRTFGERFSKTEGKKYIQLLRFF